MITVVICIVMVAGCLSGCGEKKDANTFKVGICNFVDDASLNQIVDNIRAQLEVLGKENNVTFQVLYDNCNADANVMNQIIQNFISNKVDLMVGIATPVAMAMQAATEDNKIPVIFAAVSDPLATGIVESLEKPGANITGTSDYLDTNAVFNLIFAANPEADLVGLLYDAGQDASTTAIAQAKEYLSKKGVAFVEHTGTNVSEVMLAADSMILDGVDAIFTPSDNTIMQAELSIYEKLAAAKIPHYTGADSFALNGAFLGYGVDYANLGVETANMVKQVLVDKKDPANLAVKTFDNGTATVNTETCAQIGFDYETIKKAFQPLCTKVQEITTAESFK
ncbi:MAG: ABC transporter substrate-binding protein [Lachnospiraceae bacterium]|nr:ABC transporter substrate-binding protein [Lachnospiraceae bacterium]MBP5250038.1 ABC transporter substrate-binding protein [Lachnospiraceae bacterium]